MAYEDCIDDQGWPIVAGGNASLPGEVVEPRPGVLDQPPAITISDNTACRPFELLVDTTSTGFAMLQQKGYAPKRYTPDPMVKGDWRARIWGPARADVNTALAAVDLELVTVATDVLSIEPIDGVHLNYLYFGAKGTSVGPYGWARIAQPPAWPQCPAAQHGPPTLAVLDTGLPAAWDTWHTALDGVVELEALDVEPAPTAVGVLDHAYGHGLFIAGLVHQVAPEVRTTIRRVMTYRQTDDALMGAELLRRTEPVISLSLVGSCQQVDTDEPIALRRAVAKLVARGTAVIAAAGNSEENVAGKFPATLPDVIAVGAYDSRTAGSAAQASFSNFGDGIDVWAPGVCLRSTYVHGLAEHQSGAPFTGWATWSGTSFATPLVAGRIAEMVRTSTNGKTPLQIAKDFVAGLPAAPFTVHGRIFEVPGLTE